MLFCSSVTETKKHTNKISKHRRKLSLIKWRFIKVVLNFSGMIGCSSQ